MSTVLFTCAGGDVSLPTLRMCDREEGGHLVVHPPQPVWERHALPPHTLAAWSLLVAATGQAMLACLPCLQGGCLNYWEAGNWALHPDAPPQGPKTPQIHRRVHHHVLGRCPTAQRPGWRWGEAPVFAHHDQAQAHSDRCQPLNDAECAAVRAHLQQHWPFWAQALGERAAERAGCVTGRVA